MIAVLSAGPAYRVETKASTPDPSGCAGVTKCRSASSSARPVTDCRSALSGRLRRLERDLREVALQLDA